MKEMNGQFEATLPKKADHLVAAAVTVLACLVLALSYGCGKKGPPRPPEEAAGKRVLSAQRAEDSTRRAAGGICSNRQTTCGQPATEHV